MPKKTLNWEKLDNTANIFPAIATEEMSSTYRLTAVLTEPVDALLLQEAVDRVTPQFPGFAVRLRAGIFWYYFEENTKPAPRVRQEEDYPCRAISAHSNNNYLFRVLWYRNRIHLEVFHALADGLGGLTFLKELTFAYLRLAHPGLKDEVAEGLSEDTSLDREDSFLSHYRSAHAPEYKVGPAYLVKGERLPYKGFGVATAEVSVSELKAMARKKYNASINEYLVACFLWGVLRSCRGGADAQHPIRIAVPVNLRGLFPSETTKNFFAIVSAEFALEESREYTFSEICAVVSESLKSQIRRDNLEAIFSYNVSNEQRLVARAVPLFLKNIAMRLVYRRSALANTATVTNVGSIRVPEPYKPYLSGFIAMLSLSKGQGLKGSVCSYEDRLFYTFSTQWKETAVIRDALRQMTADGLSVSVETNGLFSEEPLRMTPSGEEQTEAGQS